MTDIQESNTNITQQATRSKHTQALLKKEIGKTNALQSRNSDRIAYVAVKQTNQIEDGIQRDFWNTLHISKSFSADRANKNGNRKEPIISSLNASAEGNTWTLLSTARNNTLQKVKSFRQQNDDIVLSALGECLGRNGDGISSRTSNVIAKAYIDAEEIQALENRTDQGNWQSHEEDDLMKAASFGLKAMHDLYHIKEPKLYSMGKHRENRNCINNNPLTRKSNAIHETQMQVSILRTRIQRDTWQRSTINRRRREGSRDSATQPFKLPPCS